MYMGLGIVAMIFGFMYFLAKNDSQIETNMFDKLAFMVYTGSIIGLCGSFLVSGAISTPRRFATHLPEWMGPALFGAISGVFLAIATTIFVIHFIRYLAVRNKVEYIDERLSA